MKRPVTQDVKQTWWEPNQEQVLPSNINFKELYLVG